MRSIKFRAWDKVSKSWVKVKDFSDIDNDGQLYPVWTIVPESNVELVQFTGLKDKNGKEIYEGDIHKLAEGILAIVEWDEKCAAFQSQKIGGEKRSSHLFGIEFGKVIGNIYENPELIS